MRIYVSMTRTLLALIDGRLDLAELAGDDVAFMFSCQREHVLTPGWAPNEVTWRTSTPQWTGNRVATAALPADLAATFEAFRDLVAAAEVDGRVRWGQGTTSEPEPDAPVFTAWDTPASWEHPADAALALAAAGHTVHDLRTFAPAKH